MIAGRVLCLVLGPSLVQSLVQYSGGLWASLWAFGGFLMLRHEPLDGHARVADPFAQRLAATTNAALPSQTAACSTTTADRRGKPASDPHYRFSINRPDRYLWMTLDSSVW